MENLRHGLSRDMLLFACTLLPFVEIGACAEEPRVAGRKQQPAGNREVQPDENWNALFARTEGWTGSDVIGSVDLLDGRALWVFGDSWIGKIVDGGHAPGSRLVNNSIAAQKVPKDNTAALNPDDLRFFWGPNNSNDEPTAWVVPDAKQLRSTSKSADEEQPLGWFWTSGGGVAIPQDGKPTKLVVFLFHVGRASKEDSVWNFKSLGSAMAVVDDVSVPAENWTAKQFTIPYAVADDAAKADDKQRQTSWGMAAMYEAADDAKYVYIFGTRRESQFNTQAVLARVPAAAIEQFDQWRFYAGDGKWSANLNDAVGVTGNVVSEYSVERLTQNGKMRYMMVHSEPLLGKRIFLRTAQRPEGPWSKPRVIYTVPDVEMDAAFFTYAAKGHLQFSRPGELLVSYVVNSNDFGKAIRNASIYRPKFIRVPLGDLLK